MTKVVNRGLFLLLISVSSTAWGDSYTGGNEAYDKGNLELALKMWEKSSDPRAWFSIGKVALTGKINNCDPVYCAARWFYRSGDAGYIPALIDLAVLNFNNGYKDDGVAILKVAARWNSADARRLLGEMSQQVPEPDLFRQHVAQQRAQAQAEAIAKAEDQRNLQSNLLLGMMLFGAMNSARPQTPATTTSPSLPPPITRMACRPDALSLTLSGAPNYTCRPR